MDNDSTYVVQAERVTTYDTVFYQINKKDLKTLYEQAFGDMIDEDSAKDQLVLTFTYIPLILIFTLLISLVNVRWNRAYRRLKSKQDDASLTEEDMVNIRKLDLQYYEIPDRIFFYLVVWVVAAILDTLIILNGILEVPWLAISAACFTAWRVFVRLVGGSTLRGIDDNDLLENYGKHIKGMLFDGIIDKIKGSIKTK